MEKLTRDLLPRLLAEDGETVESRIAGEGEYRSLLRTKLYEEVGEYVAGGDVNELADVLEVVYALAAVHGLSRDGLERMRAAKAAERGGFSERVVLRMAPLGLPNPAEPEVVRQAVRALLLDRNGDLVLVKRVKPGHDPYWSTPGGEIEPEDADAEAALRRELDEELGATAGPLRHVFTYSEQTLGLRYESSFYAGRLESMDLSRRHGPEFDDPNSGTFEVTPVHLTQAAVNEIALFPPALADFLSSHIHELPGS